jgi:hypothetical protein
MQRHVFNTILHNNNNVGLHTFVRGEKLDLKITSKLKEQNSTPQEMWENNYV